MELSFLEYKKVKKWDAVKDQEVEEDEADPVPFETHPHELVSSVAKRYAQAKYERNRALAPPPGMKFFLRVGTTGVRINPDLTVRQIQKDGVLLVQLGTSF